MPKPDVVLPKHLAPGGRTVTIHTNLAEAVSGALYYELMVAWHAGGSPEAMRKYNDKIYQGVEKNFGQYVDARARLMPKKYHHVYEWGGNGIKTARLWRMRKRNNGDSAMYLRYDFLTSKKVAPIHPSLQIPGPNGKVVKRSTVFKNKAFIMDEGIPVTVRRKQAKWLAMPETYSFERKQGIIFSKGPVTVKFPGGPDVRFSFAKTFSGYFSSGLAVKQLKSSGVLDTPARLTRLAGNDVPSAIYSATVASRGINKAGIESMAKRNVERYSGR
jgi:hypothetical protein